MEITKQVTHKVFNANGKYYIVLDYFSYLTKKSYLTGRL